MARIQLQLSRLFLAVTMLIAFFVVVAPRSARGAVTGTGTTVDPYVLSTCTELATIDDTIAALAKSYALAANIDCTGTAWTPLANGSTYFTGTLDGRGHSVDNLAITCTANNCGMFKQINSGASISNLTMRWAQVDGVTYQNIGAMVGLGYATVSPFPSITNSSVVASRIISSGTSNVGGFVGAFYGTLTDVSFNGVVDAMNASTVGGIAGAVGTQSGSYTARITRAISTGNVRGKQWVGGVVGHIARASNLTSEGVFNSTNYATVQCVSTVSCFTGGVAGGVSGTAAFDDINYGDVLGSGTELGGVVGSGYVATTIKRAVNFGRVASTSTGTYSSIVGGILGGGNAVGGTTMQQSYNVGAISGDSRIGGLSGHTGYLTIENSYSRGKVSLGASGYGGGLNGYLATGSIKTSYAANTFGPNVTYAWGVSGYTMDAPSCTNTFWDATVSGRSTSLCGATSKTTTQMKNVATFTTIATGLTTAWDFVNNPNADVANNDYWNIDPSINDGYPYLVGLPGQARSVAPTVELVAPASTSNDKTFTVFLRATSGDVDCNTISNAENIDFTFTNASSVYVYQASSTECGIVITTDFTAGSPANVSIGLGANFSVNGTDTKPQTSLAGSTSYSTTVSDGGTSTTAPFPIVTSSTSSTTTTTLASTTSSTTTTTLASTTSSTTTTTLASTTSSSTTSVVSAQTISFGTLPDRLMGIAPFSLTATATSGLLVTFSSVTPAVCTVITAIVTVIASGTCSVQANQAGNVNWASAPSVIQSFFIADVSINAMPSSTSSSTTPPMTTTIGTTGLLEFDGDSKSSVSETFSLAGFYGTVLTSDGSTFSVSKTGLVTFRLKTGYIGKTVGSTKATYVDNGKKKSWVCSMKPFTVGKINKKAKRSVNNWFPKKVYLLPSRCQMPTAMQLATKSQKVLLSVTINFVKWWPTTGKPVNPDTGLRIPAGKRSLRVNIGA